MEKYFVKSVGTLMAFITLCVLLEENAREFALGNLQSFFV